MMSAAREAGCSSSFRADLFAFFLFINQINGDWASGADTYSLEHGLEFPPSCENHDLFTPSTLKNQVLCPGGVFLNMHKPEGLVYVAIFYFIFDDYTEIL